MGTTEVTEVKATTEIVAGVGSLEQWANTLVVQSQDEYESAMQYTKGVKAMRKTIVDFFADSKAKAHATWKAIVGNEKHMTDRLDIVEAKAKRALMAYVQAEEKKRSEEQRRLQAEADAAAAKERARLEAQAAKLKTPEKIAERLEAAEAIVAPVVQVASVVQPVQGTSIRKLWKHEIVDMQAFFAHCLETKRFDLIVPNDKALAAYATAAKEMATLPGVRFFTQDSLAIGGR